MNIRNFLYVLLALALVSCGSSGKGEEKSAGEIIDNYVDTLVEAPKKARAAKEALEAKQKLTEAEERALRELDQ